MRRTIIKYPCDYKTSFRFNEFQQARLPMDTLEQYVKDCFSGVPSNGLPPDDFTSFKGRQSFDTPHFKRIYKIKPVKDLCQVK